MRIYEYFSAIVNKHLNNTESPNRPDDLPIDKIMDIASRNHISYMVFSELIHDKDCTDDQLKTMRDVVKSSIVRALFQDSELKQIERRFEEEGINNLPLKGAVLKKIYPRPELREMSDIDILVGKEEVEKAAKLLVDMGYENPVSIKHHTVLTKKPYMLVEVHKTLYDKSVDNNQYCYFEGFDKAIRIEGYNYTYEFTNEDFYVYMIAHAAKHFYARGCGIRNLIDVYVFLEKYRNSMNMDYVREELKKCGIYDFAINIEHLAYDWIEGKELDDFYESLLEYMMDSGIYGKDENGIWNKLATEEGDSTSKVRLMKWYLFPPFTYMIEYYPWVEGRLYLLPVAWIARIFKGAYLHKGSKKRKMIASLENDKILSYKRIYKRMNLNFSCRQR